MWRPNHRTPQTSNGLCLPSRPRRIAPVPQGWQPRGGVKHHGWWHCTDWRNISICVYICRGGWPRDPALPVPSLYTHCLGLALTASMIHKWLYEKAAPCITNSPAHSLSLCRHQWLCRAGSDCERSDQVCEEMFTPTKFSTRRGDFLKMCYAVIEDGPPNKKLCMNRVVRCTCYYVWCCKH